MPKFCKHISCLIGLLLVFCAYGQDLPTLGLDSGIKRGDLPDGIRFYLVTHLAKKGFADFALVQRGVRDVSEARAALEKLPHFGTRKPYRFLADHGVGYAEEGFISLPGDAALFTFHDVPTYEESVADSTLLMLFDIAAQYRKPQAVIVCGDIDAARLRERMELLSMMVPTLEKDFKGTEYRWTPRDSVSLLMTLNTTADVAAINAIFSTQRLPAEVMNTPQPLVSKVYSDQLGDIVRTRVERSFRLAGIPLADFQYRYIDSAMGAGDERHSFTVYTSARQLDAATRQFASVLSSLDKEGAGEAEFRDTKARLISEAKRHRDGRRLTNRDYVDKCVSSYLYGANLASESTLNDFIVNRRLDDERERGLFNNFAQALLDSARNLTLRYDIPDRGWSEQSILRSFNEAWARPAPAAAFKANFGDTLSLFQPKAKVRLRSETAEPISGGRLWTFSNGIKVIYKKMAGQGEFRYAMLLRGGVADVPSLQAGESAFVSDMLPLSAVAGLGGSDFRDMLQANGITLEQMATLSDLRITGLAPKSKLPLLMRALLSIADTRQPEAAAFDYYKSGETLRIDMEALSPRDVNSLMDSLMRPDYFYTERKQVSRLRDDLPARAEPYFATLFDKVGDGIFVFMGDLDEDVLKRELTRTLGDFRTGKQISQRPRVDSRFATGSVFRTDESAPGVVGGGEIGVNVAMSAAIPFSMENYMTFQVACAVIREHLTAALADRGAFADLSDRLELFPEERLSVYINCHPCRADGLPAGISPADPLELLDAVRSVTRQLDGLQLDDSGIKAYKDLLLKQMDSQMSDPEALVRSVLTRYGEGKDLVTGYKAAIQHVTAAGVADILARLRAGAEVEYVII